jgi:hypothetical protein
VRWTARRWAKLQEILENMNGDAQGRQLLTLFRMSRPIPFRHDYLASTESFLKEYAVLKSRLAKKEL